MPKRMAKESMPLKISMKEELEKDLKSEYLLIGLAKLRPYVSADEMKILLKPNQGEKGKAAWAKLIKSDDLKIKDALAYILTGMGLDPDEFVQGNASR